MEPRLKEKRARAEDRDSEASALESFKIFVDLYKHHIDLWLKGYLVYLATIGVIAGFLFSKETVPTVRWFLILFLVTVSAVSVAAWTVGLVWLRRFDAILRDLSLRARVPTISLFGFKAVVLLGLIGAIIITASALLLWRLAWP
jgi:hypothetical protein